MVKQTAMNASPIRCLISAGPTREYFDPVRFLSNPSSGKMGYAIAQAAVEKGWVVDLVSGPVNLDPPKGAACEYVETGEEMYEAIRKRFQNCDLLIMTAAIMDYRPKEKADTKVKKNELKMVIEMEPVVDVLKTVAAEKEHQLIVGFAAETNNVVPYAEKKLQDKGADFVIANRIGQKDTGFESEENKVMILGRDGTRQTLGPESKALIGRKLIDFLAPFAIGRVESSRNS